MLGLGLLIRVRVRVRVTCFLSFFSPFVFLLAFFGFFILSFPVVVGNKSLVNFFNP